MAPYGSPIVPADCWGPICCMVVLSNKPSTAFPGPSDSAWYIFSCEGACCMLLNLPCHTLPKFAGLSGQSE
ncbi:fibroblast growth factor 3 [Clarias magur]|uniref:Fibroblast growth factor 3 n=1 Tax=Clarias magur TaxID=1594786 RepID=A0A8J4TW82_CLAMG|nr:fibroblast growth factor 3 [Clarias magur]